MKQAARTPSKPIRSQGPVARFHQRRVIKVTRAEITALFSDLLEMRKTDAKRNA